MKLLGAEQIKRALQENLEVAVIHNPTAEGARRALAQGADPMVGLGPRKDLSFFEICVMNDDPRVLAALLERVHPIGAGRDGHTLLGKAARLGSPHCIQLLLDHGWNPDKTAGPEGRSALAIASFEGGDTMPHLRKEACIKLLLPRCDPNRRDSQGLTALMVATSCLLAGPVALLAPATDWTLRDLRGRTALDHAREAASRAPQTDLEADWLPEAADPARCIAILEDLELRAEPLAPRATPPRRSL